MKIHFYLGWAFRNITMEWQGKKANTNVDSLIRFRFTGIRKYSAHEGAEYFY